MFVQKSPAATIETLAQAMLEIYNAKNEIKIIGTRHGEKLYETLVCLEDMAKADDLGQYYRIPADNRDLNYDQYFIDGNKSQSEYDEYHSHNTKRLSVKEMKSMLLNIDIIRKDLK